MKKVLWVFQGDSITDAGRDRRNYHDMGNGYPKYAAEHIKTEHPDIEFEFINQGISGNRTSELFDRFYTDALAFSPDVVSILIGVNDVWHRYHQSKIATTDEQIKTNYRALLERIRRESDAKIVMICPFLFDHPDVDKMREDVEKVKIIVRSLADEFADVFIPVDKYLEEAMKVQPEPYYYSCDGVHPNENGAKFIGRIYADAVKDLLDK